MRALFIVTALVGLGAAAAAPPDVPPAEPVKAGVAEHVEVRLVTIDVVALDNADRTVPGLGKESFRLFVDGKETSIDTLDSYCDGGPESDPHSKRPGKWTTPPDLAHDKRRVVLLLDYLHLPSVPDPDSGITGIMQTEALEAYRKTLEDKPEIHDEEIMVAALNGGLRVEQPFTSDRSAVVETLRRMQYDVTLYAGHFAHTTEYGFFAGLGALMTLLRATPGPKSVVFLTAGEGPSEDYDGDFARLATLASDAQARIYPVDCRGLFLGHGFS